MTQICKEVVKIAEIKNNQEFIPFSSPLIQQEEIDAVVKCLQSGWIGTGPIVAEFEKNFADFKGVQDAAAVNSCTAAIQLSLIASDIKNDDEVITTAMTFCSTVNAIINVGATPILIDVDSQTQNINVQLIEEKITSKTRAIIVVHFAGQVCEMDEVLSLAKKYNLKVIEDCAHAIESSYNGKPAGTLGDFGCFSFYSTKNITTVEGGMVVAKQKKDLDKIRVLSLHGMDKDAWSRYSNFGYKHYDVIFSGFKYNLTDVQASIGIEQLKKIDNFYSIRTKIWDYYQNELTNCPVTLPIYKKNLLNVHSHHLFTIQIDENYKNVDRDDFIFKMKEKGIGVGVHYKSIPSFSYYRSRFNWKSENWPISKKIGNTTVSLPLSPKLCHKDTERIVEAVKKILI